MHNTHTRTRTPETHAHTHTHPGTSRRCLSIDSTSLHCSSSSSLPTGHAPPSAPHFNTSHFAWLRFYSHRSDSFWLCILKWCKLWIDSFSAISPPLSLCFSREQCDQLECSLAINQLNVPSCPHVCQVLEAARMRFIPILWKYIYSIYII